MRTVHSPVVGALMKTQGQATSQLHDSKYEPARFHLLAMFRAKMGLTIKDSGAESVLDASRWLSYLSTNERRTLDSLRKISMEEHTF